MKLIDYRIAHNLRREDVASRSGLALGTVRRIELGEACSLDTAMKIVRATNGEVTPEDLETGADPGSADSKADDGETV